MVAIEINRPFGTRPEPEYFYAWVRFSYGITKGRVSWDKGDSIGRIKKWLILHNYKITPINLRRDYTHLSVEDSAMLKKYEKELQEFVV